MATPLHDVYVCVVGAHEGVEGWSTLFAPRNTCHEKTSGAVALSTTPSLRRNFRKSLRRRDIVV